ncbi:MAG: hypothetical protein WCI45_08575 [Desulfuromonadales bacterium]
MTIGINQKAIADFPFSFFCSNPVISAVNEAMTRSGLALRSMARMASSVNIGTLVVGN